MYSWQTANSYFSLLAPCKMCSKFWLNSCFKHHLPCSLSREAGNRAKFAPNGAWMSTSLWSKPQPFRVPHAHRPETGLKLTSRLLYNLEWNRAQQEVWRATCEQKTEAGQLFLGAAHAVGAFWLWKFYPQNVLCPWYYLSQANCRRLYVAGHVRALTVHMRRPHMVIFLSHSSHWSRIVWDQIALLVWNLWIMWSTWLLLMLTSRTAALKTDLQAAAETFANEAAARIWAGPPLCPQNFRHRFRVLVCLCLCRLCFFFFFFFVFISGLLFCFTCPSRALLLLNSFLDGTFGACCIGDYGVFKSRLVPLAYLVGYPPCSSVPPVN